MSESKLHISPNGTRRWRNSAGKLHGEGDLPAIEYPNGDKEWWKNGLMHRENGPAIVSHTGLEQWKFEGKAHRDNNLPAITGAFGTQWYYVHGKLHRSDGPAAIKTNGRMEWWIDGEQLNEKEFLERTEVLVKACR